MIKFGTKNAGFQRNCVGFEVSIIGESGLANTEKTKCPG
jgi:hypothetical protein